MSPQLRRAVGASCAKGPGQWAIGGWLGPRSRVIPLRLFGLTVNAKLFGDSAKSSRFVGGLTVDATTVSINGFRSTGGSVGVAVGHEKDTAGFGRSVMLGARLGYRDAEAAFEEAYGASLAGTIGIPQRFQLFAQIDYATVSAFAIDRAWTLGTGLRVRIGPG